MNGTLKKISSTHNNLRTDVIEGIFTHLPMVHFGFAIYSEPLDKTQDIRIVETSPVQSVEQVGNVYKFNTLNSSYELIVLDEKNT